MFHMYDLVGVMIFPTDRRRDSCAGSAETRAGRLPCVLRGGRGGGALAQEHLAIRDTQGGAQRLSASRRAH